MKLKFDVTPVEFTILHTILVEHLSDEYKVWVFGSRAKNQAKYNSDLDLAIEYKEKVNYKILSKIKSDLEESKLAFKVDVLDINNISDDFRKIIEKDMILFPLKFMKKVPNLRFKEFSGEWEEKKLSELGTFKNGLNKSKEDFGFGYPFVNLMDVFGKSVVPSDGFSLVNANDKDLKLYNLIKGDVLFIRSSVKKEGVGETALVLNDIEQTTYSGFLIRFREKKKELDLLFKKYCFKTKPFRNKLISLSTTSANTNINQESLNILTLNLPSKQEQEKIASFLTSVDTKIEQLTKKEKLLQQYKKGVMQKIFTQEIRFKADDGSEFCEWEEKSLKTIFKERKLTATKANGYEHISLTTDGVVAKSERYERDFLVSDDNTKKYKVTKLNDICYNPANLKFGVISRNKYGEGIFSPIYVTFEVINADIKFIEYFVTRWDFINKVRKYEEGTVYERQAVKPEDFLKFSIAIPSIEEQNKIANFLSSIDTKIEQTGKQLEQTKEFKKALLQQMFV
jgi:type I restriction enzyme S subunit